MTLTPKTIIAAGLGAIFLLVIAIKLAPQEPQQGSKSRWDSPASSPAPSVYETKENDGGNVTVIVTPKTLALGVPPSFEVAYETHSVNLDFDAAAVATLSDSTTSTFGMPQWDGSPPGGHHRKGILSFKKPLSDSTASITLTINGVAKIPVRTLVWEVKR